MTVQRILQLPVHLANQIAAGEVVERPASVLKELLENSLDAKSSQIEIILEKGGVGLIRVQDNGLGICKEDLSLAIASHATSKIKTVEDLEGIESFGFRGEALASIGAVSRLELCSSVADQDMGWSIKRAGREAPPLLIPVPKRPGTCIEVCDLFYNTPARRKFLRSEKTENTYLEEVFKRIALSQPEVAFKFQSGKRIQRQLSVCRTLEAHTKRVGLLCGQSFVDEAHYIQAEANGLKLFGWLGSPKAMRASTDLQYFYVNGRIVRDKVVAHAIRQAYQEVSLPGRYPAYVLYFELEFDAVDVNVHPTKHEVRFRDSRTVHAFLSYAIREGLKKVDKIQVALPLRIESVDNSYAVIDQKSVISVMKEEADLDVLGEPLSILGGEFLVSENQTGLVIVDLKTARKNWIKQLFTEVFEKEEGMPKRTLLMPEIVVVGKNAMNAEKREFLTLLDRLGFEMNQASIDSVCVRAVPKLFGTKSEKLDILLQSLLNQSVQSLPADDMIDVIVNHIVETQPVSLAESKALLKELSKAGIFSETNPSLKLYRTVTSEQLRAALF